MHQYDGYIRRAHEERSKVVRAGFRAMGRGLKRAIAALHVPQLSGHVRTSH